MPQFPLDVGEEHHETPIYGGSLSNWDIENARKNPRQVLRFSNLKEFKSLIIA
jgi:hypothetical protein